MGSREGSQTSGTTRHTPAALLGCPLSLLPQVHRSGLRPSLCPRGGFPQQRLPSSAAPTPHGARLRHRPDARCPLPQVARAATLPGITNAWGTEAPAALGQNGRNRLRERRFDVLMCRGRVTAFPKVSIELRSLSGARGLGKGSQPSGALRARLRKVVSFRHPSEPLWELKEKEQRKGSMVWED